MEYAILVLVVMGVLSALVYFYSIRPVNREFAEAEELKVRLEHIFAQELSHNPMLLDSEDLVEHMRSLARELEDLDVYEDGKFSLAQEHAFASALMCASVRVSALRHIPTGTQLPN